MKYVFLFGYQEKNSSATTMTVKETLIVIKIEVALPPVGNFGTKEVLVL